MAEDPDVDVYRRFYHQSSVPTLTIDLNVRQIIDCNQAALDFLGLPRHRVIGRPGADFLAEPTPDEALRVRGLRGEITRTIRKITTERGLRVAEVTLVPAGEPGVVFIQTHDLTDLLDANAVLERRTDELQQKTATLETLAARIAHDLRGPLATIGGFVDLLRTQPESFPDEQRDAVLERVSANVRTLAGMISDMLDDATLSQAEAAEAGSTRVGDLFSVLRSIFDVDLFAVGGRLETHASVDELPVPVAHVRQILVNLVGNSVKFRALDRPLVISVDVAAVEGETRITVRDNGTGIASGPDAVELFAEGVRGPNAENVQGSGLGLAYSRSAAESLGGELVDVPTDEGACFQLRLPAVIDSVPPLSSPFGGSYAGGLTARQLDLVLQISPTPTLLIDLASRTIVRANAGAERATGRPASELLGMRGRELLVDPTDGDALRADVLLAGHGRAGTITTLQTASGPLLIEVEMAAVPDTTLSIVQFRPLRSDAEAPPTATA